jgi:hypothetical protein
MARKAPDKSAEELRAAIDTANRVSDDVKIVAMRRGKLKRCLTWRRLITQEQQSAIDADHSSLLIGSRMSRSSC